MAGHGGREQELAAGVVGQEIWAGTGEDWDGQSVRNGNAVGQNYLHYHGMCSSMGGSAGEGR